VRADRAAIPDPGDHRGAPSATRCENPRGSHAQTLPTLPSKLRDQLHDEQCGPLRELLNDVRRAQPDIERPILHARTHGHDASNIRESNAAASPSLSECLLRY
jgi:hypothetical protein